MARSPLSPKTVRVLRSLKATPSQSAADLGVEYVFLAPLVEANLVKVAGLRKHTDAEGKPSRGRPARVYAVAKKGHDRLRRLPVAA